MKIIKIKDYIEQTRKTPQLLSLSHKIIFAVCVGFFTLCIFLVFVDTVFDKERFLFDTPVFVFFYRLRSPFFTSMMKFFSFFVVDVIFVVSCLIPIFLYFKKKRSEAILFILTIVFGNLLNQVLKLIIARTRPNIAPLILEQSYSFPSGHSMNAFIFFISATYFYYHFTRKVKTSFILLSFGLLLTLCIGMSRIYLGVHYPSDVIGGYVAGLLWFLFIFIIDKSIRYFRKFRSVNKLT